MRLRPCERLCARTTAYDDPIKKCGRENAEMTALVVGLSGRLWRRGAEHNIPPLSTRTPNIHLGTVQKNSFIATQSPREPTFLRAASPSGAALASGAQLHCPFLFFLWEAPLCR